MKPPGKSTLSRMQQTAFAEQQRLELIKDAPAYIIRKRDDFASIVKLIGVIESDQEIKRLLKDRLSAQTLFATDTDVEVADR